MCVLGHVCKYMCACVLECTSGLGRREESRAQPDTKAAKQEGGEGHTDREVSCPALGREDTSS